MPGRTLPTLASAEIAVHNTSKSCYVTVGTKVYDVTSFLDDHPGGGDLILEHAGQDVKAAMEDQISHAHSEAAWEILEDCLIGFVATDEVLDDAAKQSDKAFDILPKKANSKVMNALEKTWNGAAERANDRKEAQVNGQSEGENGKSVFEATGMSCEKDLTQETDMQSDYQKHKFLDLNRPLLMQLWNGGFSKHFYLEQVHRPRHYRGGESAPLFGNFLEPLSKTPWWVIPVVWFPLVAYGTVLAGIQLSLPVLVAYWTIGLCIWTIIEYGLHRCLFHLDNHLPDNRVAITLHFLLHGIHHYLPMDRLRLVMPPTLFIALATPFWKLAHTVFFYNWYAAVAVFCGGVFGYICYDMTHYFLHHKSLPAHYRELKKYHLQHHFMDYENGFGVTSRFWDRVFSTELPPPPKPKVLKT